MELFRVVLYTTQSLLLLPYVSPGRGNVFCLYIVQGQVISAAKFCGCALVPLRSIRSCFGELGSCSHFYTHFLRLLPPPPRPFH